MGLRKQILLELVFCPNVSQRIQEADLLTQAMAFHHLMILSISECLVLVKNKMLLLVQRPSHCLGCLSAMSISDIRCTTASGVFSSSSLY